MFLLEILKTIVHSAQIYVIFNIKYILIIKAKILQQPTKVERATKFAKCPSISIARNSKTIDFLGILVRRKSTLSSSLKLRSWLAVHPVYSSTRSRGGALIAVAKFQPNYHFGQRPSGSEFLSANAQ